MRTIILYQRLDNPHAKEETTPFDWTGLAEKITGAEILFMRPTNCILQIPMQTMPAAEELLRNDYPDILRTSRKYYYTA